MEKLLIKPTTQADLELITKLLKRMRIRFSVCESAISPKSRKRAASQLPINEI